MTPTLSHREAWALMPWVLNGSASSEQQQALHRHLAGCEACRAEWAFQQALHQAVCEPAPVTEAPVEAMLARFWRDAPQADAAASEALLPQPAAEAPVSARAVATGPGTPQGSGRRRGAWAWAGAALLLAAAAFGLGRSLAQAPAGDYRLLSEAVAPAATAAAVAQLAHLRLVPDPALPLGELQALLAREGLEIAVSSADARHFGLRAERADADPAQLAALAERLRRQPGVLMVEVIR